MTLYFVPSGRVISMRPEPSVSRSTSIGQDLTRRPPDPAAEEREYVDGKEDEDEVVDEW